MAETLSNTGITKAPVGSDAGTLSAPDLASTQQGISDIESEFEPRIEEQERTAQRLSDQSVAAEQDISGLAEREAHDLSAEDEEMQHWLDHTPTRQAIASTGMHAATFLSVLTALGGKLTRLNGQQMLAAQTGIMQGINNADEQKYQESLTAWQGAYEKMRQHQERLRDAYRAQLTAYQGRADAYQKASDAARRMTGDLLDDKQRQIAQKIDLFKAQTAAWDKLQRVNIATEKLKEAALKDAAQMQHWKQVEQKTAAMPAEVKAQVAAEKQRWENAKAQKDEILRRRGQTANRLDLSDEVKQSLLDKADEELEALTLEMNRAQSNTDAIIAGYAASQSNPAAVKPPPKGGGNAAWGNATASIPPQAQQVLKANIGKPVTFTNGQTWQMEQDGTTHMVNGSAPTVH